MKVRLFASLRELAGASEVEVDGGTVGDVIAAMTQRYGPQFERLLASGSVVVNGERIAPGDATASTQALTDADEVALLPPVSGGA
jgi:molybdopterin synthase sulfur carrier subunit